MAHAALVFALCTTLGAAPSGAQRHPGSIRAEDLLPAPYADSERALRLIGALRRTAPADVDLALAAAREGTAMGVLAATPERRVEYLDSAIVAARVAVAVAPECAEAHYWLAASLGLDADQQGGRAKISLAREAYAEALRTLELDPHHGGAHHIVGRLHSGAQRLSWFSRVIARSLGLGEILSQASPESAEANLRLAVQEDPAPWVHHLELAKLLLQRGDEREGIEILRFLVDRPPRNPLDAHYRAEAESILDGVVEGAAGTGPERPDDTFSARGGGGSAHAGA